MKAIYVRGSDGRLRAAFPLNDGRVQPAEIQAGLASIFGTETVTRALGFDAATADPITDAQEAAMEAAVKALEATTGDIDAQRLITLALEDSLAVLVCAWAINTGLGRRLVRGR